MRKIIFGFLLLLLAQSSINNKLLAEWPNKNAGTWKTKAAELKEKFKNRMNNGEWKEKLKEKLQNSDIKSKWEAKKAEWKEKFQNGQSKTNWEDKKAQWKEKWGNKMLRKCSK